MPRAWEEQLKIGGIIVAPVESAIVKVTKTGQKTFIDERFEGFAFVPLIRETEDGG
jgi:protein-L-isoaspartate O-methyltransferase